MLHYIKAGHEWSSPPEQIFTFWYVCPLVIGVTSREATGAVCLRTAHLLTDGWIESQPIQVWGEE